MAASNQPAIPQVQIDHNTPQKEWPRIINQIQKNVTQAIGRLVIAGVPIGFMGSWPTAEAPENWIICNGQTLPIAQYTQLYSIIGTTFNTGGEGASGFRLPTASGRTVLYAGESDESGATEHSVGELGGEETHALTAAEMPVHTHVQNAHQHFVSSQATAASGGDFSTYNLNTPIPPGVGTQVQATTAVNQNAGSGSAHSLLNPYVCVGYLIIKYQ